VPIEFDASELDTVELNPEGTCNVDQDVFTLHEENPSLVNSQIASLVPSGKHTNGVVTGPNFKRSFFVSFSGGGQATMGQAELKAKTEEIIHQLITPKRKQIPFRMCYNHLGENPATNKRKRRSDSENSDKKRKSKKKKSKRSNEF